MKKLLAGLLLLAANAPVNASECESTLTMEHNRWYQISLPCRAYISVENVFGHIGQEGVYWAVYQLNEDQNGYEVPEVFNDLQYQRAYWAVQLTGVAQQVKIEGKKKPSPYYSELAFGNGWYMTGNPFNESQSIDDSMRLNVDSTDPGDREILITDSDVTLFAYNGIDYDTQYTIDTIDPWQGFWVKVEDSYFSFVVWGDPALRD